MLNAMMIVIMIKYLSSSLCPDKCLDHDAQLCRSLAVSINPDYLSTESACAALGGCRQNIVSNINGMLFSKFTKILGFHQKQIIRNPPKPLHYAIFGGEKGGIFKSCVPKKMSAHVDGGMRHNIKWEQMGSVIRNFPRSLCLDVCLDVTAQIFVLKTMHRT